MNGALHGHERVVSLLRAAILGDRPAHAYLFAGPVGVGKRTVAQQFAAGLLCDAPIEGAACGRCPQCARVAAGVHPDLHVVRREEDRRDVRVEQVRDVIRRLVLRPLMARRSLAVLEDAEWLNEHGQNALLKTLEEPPGSSVLLLIATDASILLPTIRSRCQRVRLDPLPRTVVDAVLAERGVPADVRGAVVPRAGGSPGRALALAAEPGEEARTRMLAQLGALPRASAADLSATAQALGRDDAGVALETALSWYRDLLSVLAEPDAGDVRNVDATERLHAVAGRSSVPRVLRALDLVCDASRAIEANANRVLALETMLLGLRRLEHGTEA